LSIGLHLLGLSPVRQFYAPGKGQFLVVGQVGTLAALRTGHGLALDCIVSRDVKVFILILNHSREENELPSAGRALEDVAGVN
jgi:hypothetical protein